MSCHYEQYITQWFNVCTVELSFYIICRSLRHLDTPLSHIMKNTKTSTSEELLVYLIIYKYRYILHRYIIDTQNDRVAAMPMKSPKTELATYPIQTLVSTNSVTERLVGVR